MEIFILLHSNVYETADGKVIGCSLFRENLTDKMNRLAESENQNILFSSAAQQSPTGHLYIYNKKEDNWAKWNGRHWIERLSIERYEMV